MRGERARRGGEAARSATRTLPGVAALAGNLDTPLRIGLVLHPRRDVSAAAQTVVRWARGHGAQVVADAEDAERAGDGVQPVDRDRLAAVDAIVSLGGDGTMLGALRLVAERPVPVLGVNLGRLGFLVEVGPDELPAALDQIEAGRFELETHHGLAYRSPLGSGVAFNDVVLARVPGEGAVQGALSIRDRGHGRYRCDAVVISTPMGSTAYSYAAGGPIVSPGVEALIVSVVAPMSGVSRPLVVSPDEPLTLELTADSGPPALEVDGTVRGALAPGATIALHLARAAAQVVRLDADRYHRRNQVKLSLLDLPYLPDELRELTRGELDPGDG